MYEFTKTIVVDGTPYRAGDRVREADVPAGCFASLTRLRHLVPVAEPTPAETFEAVMTAPPAPDAGGDLLTLDAPGGALVGPPGEPPAAVEQKPEPPKPADPKHKKK